MKRLALAILFVGCAAMPLRAADIERAVIISHGSLIAAPDFPTDNTLPPSDGATLPAGGVDLNRLEHSLLLQALDRAGHNLTRAAQLLGIGRGALRYRLEKHGINCK